MSNLLIFTSVMNENAEILVDIFNKNVKYIDKFFK